MKALISVLVSLSLGVSLHAQTPSKRTPKPSPKAVTPVQPVKKSPVAIPGAKPPVPGVRSVPTLPGALPTAPGLPAGVIQPQASKAIVKTGLDGIAAGPGQVIDGSNWDDQNVADEYSKYTGQRVLLSSATQNLEIRFFQRGPLTNRQAANLLVKILDMEGFVFVPSGANEVKLLPKAQGTGSNGPAELEGIIDDPNDIPEGDNYISYFMKLRFIKPEEAVRTFTQSIHGLGPGAKIAPVPNASAVLITGKAAFVRKLLNQQRYIDVPTGNVSTVWVQLKYADSEEIAATLNEIMNAQQQRKTTAGVTTAGGSKNTGGRPPVPGSVSKRSSSASSSAGEDIPVQIVASPRLNKIFIMGRPVDIVFVEGLAREFDAPPNNNNFIKRKLRFMIASDFLDVAAKALEAVSGTSTQGGGGRQTTQNRNQTNSRNTGNTGNTNRNGQAGGGGSSGGESVQEFNVSDVPEPMVIGKTLIVADNLNNSILVQGPPESLRIVSDLIDKLDGRPQQVMISTVFGEMTLGKLRDVGVGIGRVSKANGASEGSSRDGAGSVNTGIGALQDLDALGTIAGLAGVGSNGLNIYGRVKDITGMLHALETQSNFKVLSRPTVYTANNRKAVISSGTSIAVPTNQSSGNSTGSFDTRIEYRDVALSFEVVPLINSDEEVTLRISLVNDTVGADQIVGDLTVPTIITESISTTVTVPNNATVVLGGLVTETERNTKTGVPVLSQIPGIGRLFSRKIKEVDRRELLIFIQPRIITGEPSQYEAQDDMERRYEVASPTRDFADGVLPGKPGSRVSTSKKKSKSKPSIPAASKRPALRYPTRR